MAQWEFIEKRFQEVEKRIDKLEKDVRIAFQTTMKFMNFFFEQLDLTLGCALFISNITDFEKVDALKTLEAYLKNEKKIIDNYITGLEDVPGAKTRFLEWTGDRINDLYSIIINHFEIGFDEFSEMAIRIFGAELAKELIPINTIIRLFGSEYAKQWKEF